MLYTLAVILLLAWLLGLVGIYTIGASVNVLLVAAIDVHPPDLLSSARSGLEDQVAPVRDPRGAFAAAPRRELQ